MNELTLILMLGLSARAVGFASNSALCHLPSSSCQQQQKQGSSSSLLDSLFSELFENGSSGSSSDEEALVEDELPPANYNDDAPPFSEFESAQDRARRMEMARELQKAFYKEEPTSSSSSSSSSPSSAYSSSLIIPNNINNNAPYGSTVLRNLPTLTSHDGIKSADKSALLPGYQFVWNIHNPQHCHMFHSILSGPAPWFFAHVHLPNASSSMIPSSSKNSQEDEEQDGDANFKPIDNVQAHKDVQEQLKSDSPVYGTLLRITDRRFQDEDGRIVLAVQAVDRIQVHNVASMPGTSLCTDVQISPEQELMKMYFDRALMASASYLSKHSNENSEALSCPSAISGAARAAAAADGTRVRRFEYLPIFLEEKPKRPTGATSLRSNPNDSNATRKIKDAIRKQDQAERDTTQYINVVQLVNYDVFGYSSMGNSESATSQALKTYWKNLAKETGKKSCAEDDLFDTNGYDSSSSFFLPEPTTSSSSGPVASPEKVEMMEYHVWRTLDEMIRLLSMAAAATVPLPSQLLGLLPKRDDWPREFALEAYAKSLSTSGSTIGTAFKSPFVRVDAITSTNPASYSSLRRAQRLSYAIWLLLDGLAMAGAEHQPPPRHIILGVDSIEKRLSYAKDCLDGINVVLKKMIQENQKDNDNKKK